jgi:DNA-binding NarL/FixJ family response regulator
MQCGVGIMPIKVLLADDSAIVRQSIRLLLRSQSEIELVGEAVDYPQTIRMMNELNPEVILLDLHMPGETQAMLLDVKSHLKHNSRLLAISFFNDETAKTLAESLGAAGFLDKTEVGLKLIPTIMQLASPRKTAA